MPGYSICSFFFRRLHQIGIAGIKFIGVPLVLGLGLPVAAEENTQPVQASVWEEELFREAAAEVESERYGKAYGILEKAIEEHAEEWSTEKTACVKLALSAYVNPDTQYPGQATRQHPTWTSCWPPSAPDG